MASAALHKLILSALAGLAITVTTYLAALACAAMQFHTAVVVLAWPSFALTRILPAGEPVTSDSPSTLWLPVTGFALAWIIYSSASFYLFRRRRLSSGA
jgi:hypothetical protein